MITTTLKQGAQVESGAYRQKDEVAEANGKWMKQNHTTKMIIIV